MCAVWCCICNLMSVTFCVCMMCNVCHFLVCLTCGTVLICGVQCVIPVFVVWCFIQRVCGVLWDIWCVLYHGVCMILVCAVAWRGACYHSKLRCYMWYIPHKWCGVECDMVCALFIAFSVAWFDCVCCSVWWSLLYCVIIMVICDVSYHVVWRMCGLEI